MLCRLSNSLRSSSIASCTQKSFFTTTNGNSLVTLTTQNHIATLTLNDPHRLNALSEEMGIQFQSTVNSLKQAIQRHEIRACIVTGAGDAFSAGGNLDWLEDRHNHSPHSNYQTMVQFYNFFLSIRHLNVPTIAAINGHAIGAGMCMTLGCDFRIAAENAKIGFTFVKLGIHPGMGASVLLPRLISPQKAFHYLLAGSTVSGAAARDDGLVLEAVPKEEVLSRAISLAESLSANAPIAVQTSLISLRADKFAGLDDGLHREATAQAAGYASKDLLLGLHAIRHKKIPEFNGW